MKCNKNPLTKKSTLTEYNFTSSQSNFKKYINFSQTNNSSDLKESTIICQYFRIIFHCRLEIKNLFWKFWLPCQFIFFCHFNSVCQHQLYCYHKKLIALPMYFNIPSRNFLIIRALPLSSLIFIIHYFYRHVFKI